jgi:signal transduction histidine kinase
VVQKIVDSTIVELDYLKLGYQIIVLCLIDPRHRVLKRISLSQTETARQALSTMHIPFHDIKIPLTYTRNILIQALRKKKMLMTKDWNDILCPVFTPEEARVLQRTLEIKTSMILPIVYSGRVIGTLIFSMSKNKAEVTKEELDLLEGFTDVVGLAVQNASYYSRLQDTTHKLRQANEKLKQLDQLKNEFVSIASHELRTPMGAIRSLVNMILEGDYGPVNKEICEPLQDVSISVERLINLVNNMLNVSRIEAGRTKFSITEFMLSDVIHRVISTLQPLALSRKITLTVDDMEMLHVQGDQEKVEQILNNMIGNSLKFTPENGSITLRMELKGECVNMYVTDSGVGISLKDQQKLFGKFEQVSSQQAGKPQGSGLGLYISRELARKMGGEVWIEHSEYGKGSTFGFSVPIVNSLVAQKVLKQLTEEAAAQSTQSEPKEAGAKHE